MKKLTCVAAVAVMALGGVAQAATLDFSGVDSNQGYLKKVELSNATIEVSDPWNSIQISNYNSSYSLCFEGPGDYGSCTREGFIKFNRPVKNVKFYATVTNYNAAATVFINSYNNKNKISEKQVDTYGYTQRLVDLSEAGTITRINLSVMSENGYGSAEWKDFTFDYATPVPLPAAGWMLLAGLGGLCALRRRG